MVFTTDIRVGAIKVSMNTNWAEDYIHDCLRYERGEDPDEVKLYDIFRLIENELDNKLDRLICDDGSFDTYDFFENVIGNNCEIMRLIEEVFVEVKDEDEEEELEQIGWRPQTNVGECEGCKMICEECERLVIVE